MGKIDDLLDRCAALRVYRARAFGYDTLVFYEKMATVHQVERHGYFIVRIHHREIDGHDFFTAATREEGEAARKHHSGWFFRVDRETPQDTYKGKERGPFETLALAIEDALRYVELSDQQRTQVYAIRQRHQNDTLRHK